MCRTSCRALFVQWFPFLAGEIEVVCIDSMAPNMCERALLLVFYNRTNVPRVVLRLQLRLFLLLFFFFLCPN